MFETLSKVLAECYPINSSVKSFLMNFEPTWVYTTYRRETTTYPEEEVRM